MTLKAIVERLEQIERAARLGWTKKVDVLQSIEILRRDIELALMQAGQL